MPSARRRLYNHGEVSIEMAIRPIVRLGHPALRTPAAALAPEAIESPEIQALVDDLFETMEQAQGVGLAAPQVGEELQLFVYLAVDPDRQDGPDDAVAAARRVVINPMVEPISTELIDDWEGCLSIPDLRGLVPRFPAIRMHALDRAGERIERTVEGYEARIVQHEFDHLNAMVFLDRMRDLRSLAFADEWQRYMTVGGEPETPVS